MGGWRPPSIHYCVSYLEEHSPNHINSLLRQEGKLLCVCLSRLPPSLLFLIGKCCLLLEQANRAECRRGPRRGPTGTTRTKGTTGTTGTTGPGVHGKSFEQPNRGQVSRCSVEAIWRTLTAGLFREQKHRAIVRATSSIQTLPWKF